MFRNKNALMGKIFHEIYDSTFLSMLDTQLWGSFSSSRYFKSQPTDEKLQKRRLNIIKFMLIASPPDSAQNFRSLTFLEWFFNFAPISLRWMCERENQLNSRLSTLTSELLEQTLHHEEQIPVLNWLVINKMLACENFIKVWWHLWQLSRFRQSRSTREDRVDGRSWRSNCHSRWSVVLNLLCHYFPPPLRDFAPRTNATSVNASILVTSQQLVDSVIPTTGAHLIASHFTPVERLSRALYDLWHRRRLFRSATHETQLEAVTEVTLGVTFVLDFVSVHCNLFRDKTLTVSGHDTLAADTMLEHANFLVSFENVVHAVIPAASAHLRFSHPRHAISFRLAVTLTTATTTIIQLTSGMKKLYFLCAQIGCERRSW